MDKDWLVYLLECSDTTYYCGITNNIGKRIKVHNSGKGAKYTKHRRPVKLLVQSIALTKSEALKLEHRVKKQKRQDKLLFLESWERDE